MRPAASVPAAAIPTRETFSIGSALSRSLSVWGRNLPFFLAVSFLAYVPMLLLSPGVPTSGSDWMRWLIGFAISLALGYVVTGFVTYSVLEQLRGRNPAPGAALAYGASRAGPLILAAIFTTILIFGASLFLIIPGIYFAVPWSLIAPVVIAEKGVDPRARSAELTAGHRWGLFGLLILIGIAGGILSGLMRLIVGLPLDFVSKLVGQTIPQALVLSFTAAVYGVIYYQLRSEKEGVDLEQLTSVFR